jgi:HAD superfamily hydrolase (TIGR01509 family)
VNNVSWHREAIIRCLGARFGRPVEVERPEVDWDGRAGCRAILPSGQRVVVKVDTVAERHLRESAGLRAAWHGGATVPEVLWSGHDGYWFLVLTELATRTSLANGGTLWREAGAAVRRLHASPIPAGMRMFCEGGDDWVEHIVHRIRAECAASVERGLLTRTEADFAQRHAVRVFAEAGPGTRALLHGDLQARHVLVHGDAVTLVDFGDAGWGDPVLDLVVLTHWSPERLDAVLDGYGADDALRTRIGMLWTTYSLWRHLFVSRWYFENLFDQQRSASAARRVLEQQVLGGHLEIEERVPAERIRLDCDVVLLDFDGLLVDTECAGWRSWSELFALHHGTLSIEDWARNTGSDDPLSPWDELDVAAGSAVDRIVLEARRRVRRDSLMKVLPGARRFLAGSRAAGLGVGLVSNSPMRWIERQMRNLDIDQESFDLIVPGDGHPAKPAPDGYLLALEKFGVDAARVVALEDSARGVAAAKAAGLFCVAVPHQVTVHTDLSQADLVVHSLAHLEVRKRSRDEDVASC